MTPDEKFSDQLDQWLASDAPKSLGALGDMFAEKSFAVAIVLLMLVSATPLPTGGIALVLELNAAVVSAQMILGRRTVWLPERWRHRELGAATTSKAVPFIARRIRWLERHSRPRWSGLFHRRLFIRLIGLVLLVFAITAALAPPLTGLETLPSIGAVVVALAIILEDVLVLAIGVVIGAGGIALFISVFSVVIRFTRQVF